MKLRSVRKVLRNLNLPRLIDELEHQHEEQLQEDERRAMVNEAVAACMKDITEHLRDFIHKHPFAEYEDWIRALHPDNADFEDGKTIDHRFYVEDSDHRLMWNGEMVKLGGRIVEARHILPTYGRKQRPVYVEMQSFS